MLTFVLGFALGLVGAAPVDSENDKQSAFDFYLEELLAHEMSADAPMSRLIEDYLVEATFDTTSGDIFKDRLRKIQRAVKDRPDRIGRFQRLDDRFSDVFRAKLSEAKHQRMIYTAAGAVVGALVAIPVGRAINKSAQVLWISIPAGAALGAGAGYLLGNLIVMPDYTYDPGTLNFDLKQIQDELSENSP